MRIIILLFFVGFLISCKSDKKQEIPSQNDITHQNNNPTWLIGSWERVGDKEGKKTYEYWRQNKDGEFIGLGCTLKGKDTIWKEDVLLTEDNDGWKFEVVGLGDTIPTVFRISKMDKNKFICENDENEFPKKIEYAFDGKNINAVISGGGPTIPFNFIPMK